MKTLIIEDEPILARSMVSLVRKIRPAAEIISPVSNISEALEVIGNNKDLDIIFTDIKLEDGLSFAILDKIDTNARIVFTTAYDEYALKAFDYNCVDYILKPVTEVALERAFERCENNSVSLSGQEMRKMGADILSGNIQFRKHLFLQQGQDIVICNVQDICYIQTEKGNTRVFMSDGYWGGTDLSLTELGMSLDSSIFFRVNRQTVVNLSSVSRISRGIRREYFLSLKSPFENVSVPITSERKKDLEAILH